MNNARDIEKDDILAIMRLRSGRRFLSRLISESGVEGSAFDKNPTTHALNEGRRQLGIYLVEELKECAPLEYVTMIKERLE